MEIKSVSLYDLRKMENSEGLILQGCVCFRLTAFSLMSASWRCGGLKQKKPLAARGSLITLTTG